VLLSSSFAADPALKLRIQIKMAKTDFKSVDEYIAAQPETVRSVLQRVRSAIRQALPGAEEVISYQIPTFKLHGGPVLYFAGWSSTTRFTPLTISSSRRSTTTSHRIRFVRPRSVSRSHGPSPYD
jgi:hypothetical protein